MREALHAHMWPGLERCEKERNAGDLLRGAGGAESVTAVPKSAVPSAVSKETEQDEDELLYVEQARAALSDLGGDEDDDFEALMMALQETRVAGSSMGDSARREAAAALTLKMAAMFGLLEPDDVGGAEDDDDDVVGEEQ